MLLGRNFHFLVVTACYLLVTARSHFQYERVIKVVEKEGYTYLGTVELDKVKEIEMKEK